MKAWRIHFGWAIVTVLAAVLSARMASRPDPVGPLTPGKPHSREEPTPAILPVPKAEILPADVQTPLLPSALPAGESPIEAKIRTLMKDPRSADEAVRLLKGIPDREFKMRFLAEVLKGPDEQSAYTALSVLREMKGRDVAELVESYLASHLSEESGYVAAYSLGELGDPGSIGPLSEAFRSENEQVRLYSASALMKLGFRAPAEGILADMARQFQSADGALRKKAIETICNLDPGSSVAVLAQALKDSNGDVRIQALYAFSILGRQEYLPLVQSLLKDPNPEVARQAADTVESLNGSTK